MGWVAPVCRARGDRPARRCPRAHYLTGDEEYLAGALRATNYAVGANPSNMTMDHRPRSRTSPAFPLHVDSRNTGQEPPAGDRGLWAA